MSAPRGVTSLEVEYQYRCIALGSGLTLSTGGVALIEQQLGASRAAGPTPFLWRMEGVEAKAEAPPPFRSRPAWTTEAVAAGPNGEAVVYQFEYEPFGGRLIAVTRRGGR